MVRKRRGTDDRCLATPASPKASHVPSLLMKRSTQVFSLMAQTEVAERVEAVDVDQVACEKGRLVPLCFYGLLVDTAGLTVATNESSLRSSPTVSPDCRGSSVGPQPFAMRAWCRSRRLAAASRSASPKPQHPWLAPGVGGHTQRLAGLKHFVKGRQDDLRSDGGQEVDKRGQRLRCLALRCDYRRNQRNLQAQAERAA